MNTSHARRLVAALTLALTSLFTGCGLKPPTPEELANADYGPKPALEEVPTMLRKYFKRAGYYDPNGVEIEECSALEKGWRHKLEKRQESRYYFGWLSSCDINGKNLMGGFIGFRRASYLIHSGEVVEGALPNRLTNLPPTQNSTASPNIFNPNSNFVFWK